jgi:hypothetical protein
MHVNSLSLVWLPLTITYSIISYRNTLKLVPTLSGTQNKGYADMISLAKLINWDNFINTSDKPV